MSLGLVPNRVVSRLLWPFAMFAYLTFLYTSLVFLVERSRQADFANYYFYSQLLHRDVNVYAVSSEELQKQEVRAELPIRVAGRAEYSPIFFALFGTLASLPFTTALWIWGALTVASVTGVLFALGRIGASELGAASLPLAVLVVTLSQPLIENVALGQVNTFLLLGTVLAVLLEREGAQGVAAAAWIVAAMALLKPQWSLLAVAFASHRRRGVFFTHLAGAYLAGRLWGVFHFGPEVEAAYWYRLLGLLDSSSLWHRNLSLSSVWAHLMPDHRTLATAVSLSLSVVLVVALVRECLTYPGERLRERAALAVCVTLIVSPLTEEHHLVAMAFPLLLAFGAAPGTLRGTALLSLAFVLVQLRYSFLRFETMLAGPLFLLQAAPLAGIGIVAFLIWRPLGAPRSPIDSSLFG